MTLTVLFFIVIAVIPIAWLVSQRCVNAKHGIITWVVAGLIVVCSLIAFIFRTVEDATGGEDGWGQRYKEIGEGKY